MVFLFRRTVRFGPRSWMTYAAYLDGIDVLPWETVGLRRQGTDIRGRDGCRAAWDIAGRGDFCLKRHDEKVNSPVSCCGPG
jgi:hypothetical protein